MKKCTGCGQTVKDEDVFCTNCGSTSFIPLNNVAQPNFGNTPQQGFGNTPQQGFGNAPQQDFRNAPQNGAPQQGFGVPGSQPAANNIPPKKSKKGLIIGLSVGGGILLILVILAIIGATAEKKYQFEGYGSSNESSYSSNSEQTTAMESAVPFTYGEYDDDQKIYKNEWANIQIRFDDNWYAASRDVYAQYENSYMKCGAYLVNSNKEAFMVLCSNTKQFGGNSVSVEEYLEQVRASVQGQVEIISETDPQPVVLGTETFTSKCLKIDADGVEVYYNIYTMKKDGDFITFQIITREENHAQEYLKMVEEYRP